MAKAPEALSSGFQKKSIVLLDVGNKSKKSLPTPADNQVISYANESLKDEAVQQICQQLMDSGRSILKLDLKGNDIRDLGALAVGNLIAKVTVRELSMEWNSLGDGDAAKTLCQYLQNCPTLRHLDLRNNNLGPDAGLELADAMSSSQCGLQILDLRWNHIGDRGANAFLAMIQRKKTVSDVKLNGNKISSDIVRKIEQVLIKNKEETIVKEAVEVRCAKRESVLENVNEVLQKELFELRASNAHQCEELDAIRRSFEDKRLEVDELNNEKQFSEETYRFSIKELEKSQLFLQNKVNELSKKNERLEHENLALAGVKESLDKERSDLALTIEQVNKNIVVLEDELRISRKEIARLEEQIQSDTKFNVRGKSEAVTAHQKEITKLREDFENQRVNLLDEIKRTGEERNKYLNEKMEIRAKLLTVESERESQLFLQEQKLQSQHMTSVDGRLRKFEQEIAGLHGAREELANAAKEQRVSTENLVTELTAQRVQYESELQKAFIEQSKLCERMNSLNLQIARLEGELKGKDTQMGLLETKMRELQGTIAALRERHQHTTTILLSDHKEELRRREIIIGEKDRKLIMLEAEKQDIQKRLSVATNLRDHRSKHLTGLLTTIQNTLSNPYIFAPLSHEPDGQLEKINIAPKPSHPTTRSNSIEKETRIRKRKTQKRVHERKVNADEKHVW